MVTTAFSLVSLPFLRTTPPKPHKTLHTSPNFLQHNLTLKFSRLGISYAKRKGSKQVVVSCLNEDNSNIEQNPGATIDLKLPRRSLLEQFTCNACGGATIDLKLPRRSLLVQFTCNACGVRSQKLINKLAYEKGMVFVQCTGCSQYHKLVDNLNLVVEYDFREEINAVSDADQV